MTMRPHYNPSSGNGYKVRLLLRQLGIPFLSTALAMIEAAYVEAKRRRDL